MIFSSLPAIALPLLFLCHSLCPPPSFCTPFLADSIFLNASCGTYSVSVWPCKFGLMWTGAPSLWPTDSFNTTRLKISTRQSSFYFEPLNENDFFVPSFCLLYGHSESCMAKVAPRVLSKCPRKMENTRNLISFMFAASTMNSFIEQSVTG